MHANLACILARVGKMCVYMHVVITHAPLASMDVLLARVKRKLAGFDLQDQNLAQV